MGGNSSQRHNRSGNTDILPPGKGRNYTWEDPHLQLKPDSYDRSLIYNAKGNNSNTGPGALNQRTNIEIEEMAPANNTVESLRLKEMPKPSVEFRHHSFRGKNTNKSDPISGFTGTEYCDNIEEDSKLCYRDRIVYSHRKHVNISSTHMSFRGFGSLLIYSAFLDARQTPAIIRIIVIGPKGYNNGPSSLWCAFSTPLQISKKYGWSGQEDNVASSRTQATQLHFYTASDGHGRNKQFYIMSCNVPKNHLSSFAYLDGNRMDIVAGTQSDALLETVNERVSINVINNQGLSQNVLKFRNQNKRSKQIHNENNISNNNRMQKNEDGKNNWIDKTSKIAHLLDETSSINIFDDTHHSNSTKKFVPPLGGRDAIVSCVAPIYGSTSIVQITEFIELTLLLGSQHIVIYTPRPSSDVRQILNMYRYQGLVTIMPWNVRDSSDIWAKGRDTALNDCLYRTMFLYDFVLFHDMDEFLVPKATPDLQSLIQFLRTKGRVNTTRISDIVFNSAYFSPPTKAQAANLTKMPGFTKDVPKFLSLSTLHRTYFSPQHAIRIIRPSAAIRVGAGERKRTTFNINPRFAGVHHYTKCPIDKNTQAKSRNGMDSVRRNRSNTAVDCIHTKWDDSIWRYREKLIQNTKDSIHAFNKQLKGKT